MGEQLKAGPPDDPSDADEIYRHMDKVASDEEILGWYIRGHVNKSAATEAAERHEEDFHGDEGYALNEPRHTHVRFVPVRDGEHNMVIDDPLTPGAFKVTLVLREYASIEQLWANSPADVTEEDIDKLYDGDSYEDRAIRAVEEQVELTDSANIQTYNCLGYKNGGVAVRVCPDTDKPDDYRDFLVRFDNTGNQPTVDQVEFVRFPPSQNRHKEPEIAGNRDTAWRQVQEYLEDGEMLHSVRIIGHESGHPDGRAGELLDPDKHEDAPQVPPEILGVNLEPELAQEFMGHWHIGGYGDFLFYAWTNRRVLYVREDRWGRFLNSVPRSPDYMHDERDPISSLDDLD